MQMIQRLLSRGVNSTSFDAEPASRHTGRLSQLRCVWDGQAGNDPQRHDDGADVDMHAVRSPLAGEGRNSCMTER